MKTKKGFTLAEILITLTIISTAAALTVPQIINNTIKAQAGPTLARAIQQIETGIQEYFIYKSKEKQDDGSPWVNYTKFSDINSNIDPKEELAAFLGLNYVGPENIASKNLNKYKAKNYSYEVFLEDKINLENDSATLYIDTNGLEKKPNEEGKDLFEFGIKNSGKVVPIGDEAKEVVKNGFKVKY